MPEPDLTSTLFSVSSVSLTLTRSSHEKKYFPPESRAGRGLFYPPPFYISRLARVL